MANPISLNTAALHIGTVIPRDASFGDMSGSNTPPALKDVVDKLTSSLMSGGHLNADSPLGKMVEQQLKKENPLAALMGGQNADAIKSAVTNLIKDKLGNNFGAAASAGIGGGQGGQDLMSQVMQGLSKASLNDALTPKGDGSTFSKADKPVLQQVADFMDQNKATFGAPDSGSWSKELDEDNYLNKDETAKFRAALDQISQQMGSGSDAAGVSAPQSTAGGLGSSDATGGAGDAGDDSSDVDDNQGPTTAGGLGSPQADDTGDDSGATTGASSQDSQLNQLKMLEQLLGVKDPMDLFKKGLELGASLHAHQAQPDAGGLSPQLQQQSLQTSAAHAAQNILDVMNASLS
ncbi:hypothetical protein ACW9H6_07850 [Pseudomonas sp. SDO528_S397]